MKKEDEEEEEEEEGGISGVVRRCRERQNEYAMLKKGTAMWQSVDKKYGLI